ncbi:glycosyltransferase family 4 protein [Planotetraspora phitsanulokensis]|uniref:Glycosyl transferase n=1 Tax=Planotetraspora phitsanulokensis TaxID=575192 RepID=A0A8J3U3Y0_9ACTN|nr:glycosyltransferase family 4 protein [Planotetraspora phitsanulokensis]GII37765.1 glycosyl transferase [Planotetraspora phitsanulokensis]
MPVADTSGSIAYSPVAADHRPLRIAMIGQRGLPATFGGVEHHVAHLGRRLAARGHQVTVYCRDNYVPERRDALDGMRLRHMPTVGTKHLDALAHSLVSTMAAVGAGHDIVHYHALGPGLCAPLPRYLSGARVVQTIHGRDDRRQKWGGTAKAVLRSARWLSERVPDAVIGVSREISEEYVAARDRLTVYIANGVERPAPTISPRPVLDRGLRPGRYVLFVGRLVPEKAVDVLIKAFSGVPGDIRLAITGGSSFTDDYVSNLHDLAAADPRVHMLGYVYGEELASLYRHAAVYVQPSYLEGLPLALLEAASYGLPTIASSLGCHREVIAEEGPGGRLFDQGDERHLREVLTQVLANLDHEAEHGRIRGEDVLRRYSWDVAADMTEALYHRVLAGSRRDR